MTFLHHIYSAGGENKRCRAAKSFRLLRINSTDLAHERGAGVEIDLMRASNLRGDIISGGTINEKII